jgi:gliding motility-associated lipoprotein GldD
MACNETETAFVPKQRGYARIELPPQNYVMTADSLPYSFEYSQHTKFLNDSSSVSQKYWFEIYYPAYKANIDISYYEIKNDKKKLQDFINDSQTLAIKHKIKAYAIDEVSFKTDRGYASVLFDIQGDTPSPLQFYVTDSTQNFLRASLYFPSSTQNDSLAPIISFIKKDMLKMLHTVKFKK